MNFAHDVVDAAPRGRCAIVEVTREGRRREWSFGEISERSSRLAPLLQAPGVRRGDTVMTIIGNRPARNAFIAPWLRGAKALLHDARFDAAQRLEIVGREGVSVLCMAPPEYRVIAKRVEIKPLPRLRGLVATGEALTRRSSVRFGKSPGSKFAMATARPRPAS